MDLQRLTKIRPWYVHFPLMCAGLLSSKKPVIRCLIRKSVRHLFTTTKLFHAPGFAWGKSVLRKQVIKNARGLYEYLAVSYKDNGFDIPLSLLSS